MTLRLAKYFIIIAISILFDCYTVPPISSAQSQGSIGKDQKGNEQKNKNDPVIRLETELVQIDIVVSDKSGKLVRDLRREDFELYEDGKKQQITHFAVGTAAHPATWLRVEKKKPVKESESTVTPTNAASTEMSAGRYIVIAVDDYHLAPENLLIAKRTLQRFITEQLIAGDQVAVATTSGNLGLFQQFTGERAVLERAIDRLSVQTRRVTSSTDVPHITDYQAELIDRGDQDALGLAVQEIMRLEPQFSGGSGGGQNGSRGMGSASGTSPTDRAIEQAKMKARSIVGFNATYTRTTLETLDGIIRSLRQLAGRKMLVLLSDGFFLGGNSSSQTFDLRRIVDAATRSGVVIYSIDARGLIATPPGGDASEPSTGVDVTQPGVRARIEQGSIEAKRDGLNALAHDTGGFLVVNTNDLNLGLQRILDDNETYYVLAYEPPESRRDGRFHKIDVRIADRPELKVRTRKGYLAPLAKAKSDQPAPKVAQNQKEKSPEKAAQEAKAAKDAQIRSGLASLFPLREIPVEVSADFIDTSEQGPSAMINTHIDASALSFSPADDFQRDILDMTVVIFDERGKVVHSYGNRFNFKMKSGTVEVAAKQGLSYRYAVPLKPGFYQARLAVREEETARLGSATSWVEIPDLSKKQLTLSSILLSVGEESMPSPDGTGKEEPQTMRPSTAKRKFKRGGKIDFLTFAYNAKSEKNSPDVVIQSQVYAGSKLIYASPLNKIPSPANADVQRLPYAARISLEGFDAGQYELRLMAIDRTAKISAYRRVNFTVE